eukprot:3941291-Rhodomonas_salina.4
MTASKRRPGVAESGEGSGDEGRAAMEQLRMANMTLEERNKCAALLDSSFACCRLACSRGNYRLRVRVASVASPCVCVPAPISLSPLSFFFFSPFRHLTHTLSLFLLNLSGLAQEVARLQRSLEEHMRSHSGGGAGGGGASNRGEGDGGPWASEEMLVLQKAM